MVGICDASKKGVAQNTLLWWVEARGGTSMYRSIASVLALVAALVVWGSAPAAADFTCSTVARSGQNDPTGPFPFKKKFIDLDINQSGDVLFQGRASGVQPRLYLYPLVGSPS